MNLILNAIKCLACQDIIKSTHRHDYKSCKCGKVAVDGGLEYRRRTGDHALIEEHCAYQPTGKQLNDGCARDKFIVWSPGGKTNPSVVFDCKEDAELSAKELAARVPASDWYVAELTFVPV